MKYVVILFTVLLFASCGGNSTNTQEQKSAAAIQGVDTALPVGDFYKNYTGTIAGHPVVLHLQRAGNLFNATYYYTQQGKPIDLYIEPDTARKGYLLGEERPEVVGSENTSFWQVAMYGDKLGGVWKNKAGDKTYDILLQEDKSAPALIMYYHEATIPYTPGKASPAAQSVTQLLLPALNMPGDKKDFVEGEIMKAIGCTGAGMATVDSCIARQDEAYAKEYRDAVTEVDGSVDAPMNNHYSAVRMSVVFSASDWLVYELRNEGYSGGAHGMYASGFLNLDMAGKKHWKLEDVMRADTATLSTLLDKEARRYFGAEPGQKISEFLFEDKIMPNDNFFLTDKGITFNYTPYEIAAYAMGEIRLFIPYTSIGHLLTPQFRQRMKL